MNFYIKNYVITERYGIPFNLRGTRIEICYKGHDLYIKHPKNIVQIILPKDLIFEDLNGNFIANQQTRTYFVFKADIIEQ